MGWRTLLLLLSVALPGSAVPVPQDGPSNQVRTLIEKLRSDEIGEREEAERELKRLGAAAVPELKGSAEFAEQADGPAEHGTLGCLV